MILQGSIRKSRIRTCRKPGRIGQFVARWSGSRSPRDFSRRNYADRCNVQCSRSHRRSRYASRFGKSSSQQSDSPVGATLASPNLSNGTRKGQWNPGDAECEKEERELLTTNNGLFVVAVVAAVALLPASTSEAQHSALFAPVSPTHAQTGSPDDVTLRHRVVTVDLQQLQRVRATAISRRTHDSNEVIANLKDPHPGTVKLTDFLEVPLIDMPPKSLICGVGSN